MNFFEKFEDSYSRVKKLLKEVEKADSYDKLSELEREIVIVYRRDLLVLINMVENDFRKLFNDQRQKISDGLVVVEEPKEEKPAKKVAKKTVKKTTKKTTKKTAKK